METRIKQIRKSENLTQKAFADRLGLKQNTIATYEMGRTEPSDRTIADICREFNVSEVWLRTGEGEMHIELPEDAEFDLIMTEIQESDDDLIKSILKAYWELPDTKKAAVKDWLDGVIKNLGKEKAGK
jgi:transcriptional regulator with XRE-family HTH domain|nr:MAG TPA: Helix-turn-helix XRE-family like protein [Caudoviricetes sp.]